MPTDNANTEAIVGAINEFLTFLSEDYRKEVSLSKQKYQFQNTESRLADWPANYRDVFRDSDDRPKELKNGVYLFFDKSDKLIYVGHAVSIGSRLGSYFQYDTDRSCKVKKDMFKDATYGRVISLPENLKFLGPSLECFLIARLSPPLNFLWKEKNTGDDGNQEI